MRLGIADLQERAEVSPKANEQLLNTLASVDDSRNWGGRSVRALYPWAEYKALFTAIHPGDFLIHGFRNRELQKLLYDGQAEAMIERRRRSAAVRGNYEG
jgi:hypothetical protein